MSKRSDKKWRRKEVLEAEKLHEEMSWEEVGEIFGVTKHAVRNAVRRLKLGAYDEKEEIEKASVPKVFEDVQWPENVNWREFFDGWQNVLEQHERFDPIQETVSVRLPDRPVAVVLSADLHMGGGFTSHKAIRDTIEFVLEKEGMFLGITGDSIEGFIPGLKPAETVEQQPSSVKSQLKALESLVIELSEKGKLLWMTWGDHDGKWFEQAIGVNIVKNMAQEHVPYFTGRGLLKLYVGDQSYFALINHGERFSSQWSETHSARRAYEQHFPADLVVTAHKHKPEFRMFHHYQQLREAGVNLGGKSWLVQCGTFKTGPDPYTIRTWSRGIIGVPTIVFHNETHDADMFDTPEKAFVFMEGLRK